MFACPKCSSSGLENVNALNVHLVIEHFPQLLIYQCHFSQCAYARFPTELTLIDHYLDVHRAAQTLHDFEKIQITYSIDSTILRAKMEVKDILNQARIARNKPRVVFTTEMEPSEKVPTPAATPNQMAGNDQRSITENSGVSGCSPNENQFLQNANNLADVPIPQIQRNLQNFGTKRLGDSVPKKIQKRGISVPKNTQQLLIPPINPKRRCRSQTPGRELETQLAKGLSTFSLYIKEHKTEISQSAIENKVHFMTAASQFYKSFKANAFGRFAQDQMAKVKMNDESS